MKKIALFLAVVCLAAVFTTVAFAAGDFIAFDFRTEDAIKQNATISVSGISEKQFIEGGYEVLTSNNDPYINLSIKSKHRFNAADYPVFRIDYKIIEGAPSKSQLFFNASTSGFTMGSSGTFTEYATDLTTMDYQSTVIDMELLSNSQWADTIKALRLDVATIPDCRIAVRFVGMFTNEKDALKFDYDKWAEENPPYTKEDAKEDTTTSADTATTAPATPAPATPAPAAPAEGSAPQTADPFTAVAAVMAISAGVALAIKKRR